MMFNLTMRNLSGLGDTQFVPFSSAPSGVTTSQAQTACTTAGGTWASGGIPGGAVSPSTGCSLEIGASLPAWCSIWGMPSLFPDECSLPNTPAQLSAYTNYTAYQTGLNQAAGLSTHTLPDGSTAPSETDLLNQANDQSNQLLTNPTGCDTTLATCTEANCEYNAAASYPLLSQSIGPAAVCALTDPANSSYSWLMYGGIALAALIVFGALKK